MNKKKSHISPHKPKVKLRIGQHYLNIKKIVHQHHLHTICESGNCPNLPECWGSGTATLMILGDICTRACKFCSVPTGKPLPPDKNEPEKVAKSIQLMQLSHCVITSVDRDDLPDGGAGIWAETIRQIKHYNPKTTIEVLIPDFNFNTTHLDTVIDAKPDIISHNLETTRRLTPQIRSRAQYDRSLKVLEYIRSKGMVSKSGIMLGLGETETEILQTMDDLLAIDCRIITIGQYLQPTPKNIPVARYVPEEEFEKYRDIAIEKGFTFVESGSLVRSSYHAEKHVGKNNIHISSTTLQ
jgi:lipoic acid synthetase